MICCHEDDKIEAISTLQNAKFDDSNLGSNESKQMKSSGSPVDYEEYDYKKNS